MRNRLITAHKHAITKRADPRYGYGFTPADMALVMNVLDRSTYQDFGKIMTEVHLKIADTRGLGSVIKWPSWKIAAILRELTRTGRAYPNATILPHGRLMWVASSRGVIRWRRETPRLPEYRLLLTCLPLTAVSVRFFTRARLVKITGIPCRTIGRLMDELNGFGLVEIRRQEGGQRNYLYARRKPFPTTETD